MLTLNQITSEGDVTMSDWDFLWGLTGDDLDFAISNGYTKEEYQYILEKKHNGTKILVIFTGGTIGSLVYDGWISPENTTIKFLIENCKQQIDDEIDFFTTEPYTILSENLDAHHLNKLIEAVRIASKADYDGIIVTHGTDTLQYSATALSFALGNNCIPVLLVSSNYPLSDERANGKINFEAAIEFIKQKCGKGVYIAYRNSDRHTYYHAGINLLTHLETDDNVYSLNNNFYAEYIDGKVIIHRPFVDFRPSKADNTILIEEPKILVINPCPALCYDYDLSNYNAVLIKPYHSSTLNTSSNRFIAFCQKAQKQNIPVYVSSLNITTAYESNKSFNKLGLKSISNTTFIDNYIKLWFEISKKY